MAMIAAAAAIEAATMRLTEIGAPLPVPSSDPPSRRMLSRSAGSLCDYDLTPEQHVAFAERFRTLRLVGSSTDSPQEGGGFEPLVPQREETDPSRPPRSTFGPFIFAGGY